MLALISQTCHLLPMNRTPLHRSLAAITALVVGCGLVLDFWLMLGKGDSVSFAVWRFLGYFTQLTNVAVTVLCAGIALGHPRFDGPRTSLATLNSILLVGLVYSIALRPWHHPVGLDAFTNHIVHDFAPLAFLVVWLTGPHGKLHWGDVRFALIPPVLYTAYALSRGALLGWYPYWFLNPVKEGMAKFATGQIILLASFTVMAFILVALDKWLGRRAHPA